MSPPDDAAPVAASRPPVSRADDATHAARSGFSQILARLGQGLMPLHRVLVSRLFGQAAYGVYRTGADLCEVLMRAGIAGGDKAMLKFVAAQANVGNKSLGATGFGVTASAKAEDQVTHLLELYARCRQAVEAPVSTK